LANLRNRNRAIKVDNAAKLGQRADGASVMAFSYFLKAAEEFA